MIHKNELPEEILVVLNEKIKDFDNDLEIPPHVFRDMEGVFVDFNKSENSLICRFPVLKKQLNPFGNMQGGVISAAIDNTIGPLSMLVAEPNVTRHMEVKYLKPVTPELETVIVTARLVERKKRLLFFEATLSDSKGIVCATAKATHFVIV